MRLTRPNTAYQAIKRHTGLLVWLLVFVPPMHAATPDQLTLITCRHGDDQRMISVEYPHKGWQVPCLVRYEKVSEGDISYPWQAEATPGYCERKAVFLAKKLTGFGWHCVNGANERVEPD